MADYRFCLRTSFGLESLLAGELRHLGYKGSTVENGRILLDGDARDLAELNTRLRTAARMELVLDRFPAMDFDELFDGLQNIPWENYIPADGAVTVLVRLRRSTINSARSGQSVAKKSIVKRLCAKNNLRRLEESGAEFVVSIEIEKDQALVSLDGSGAGLHRRGYRLQQGEAPLRETAAAGILLASRWFGRDPLHDPFCGSGTIAIEAALLAAGIAPQQKRRFAWQDWPFIDKQPLEQLVAEIRKERKETDVKITASDIDPRMIRIAENNAKAAGVAELIEFQTRSALDLEPMPGPGLIICNPPYGERLGDEEQAGVLYQHFGQACREQRPEWDVAVLSGHPDFSRCFGRKADKNRKLYNGTLKSYLYSFRGKRYR